MGATLISNDPLYFISCGFAGSVLSQFYSEFIFFLRSKTEFVVGENEQEEK